MIRTPLITGGLSPRVRGNRCFRKCPTLSRRSIPASAGEPGSPDHSIIHEAVYPRECGGTSSLGVKKTRIVGLSPRVRGNRPVVGWRQETEGSIPASAGEPIQSSMKRCPTRVYPRECGGTLSMVTKKNLRNGLSPRVRGNRLANACYLTPYRSIPASAGEPNLSDSASYPIWVYPRECGGTPSETIV